VGLRYLTALAEDVQKWPEFDLPSHCSPHGQLRGEAKLLTTVYEAVGQNLRYGSY
jgi:hypothetical protein